MGRRPARPITLVMGWRSARRTSHPSTEVAGPPRRNPERCRSGALDRHKPPVDDDPSARDVGTVDTQAPHRQAALGPAARRHHPDRHRVSNPFLFAQKMDA
jgi:hypothetical protein